MPFQIVHNEITKMKTDAIVNAANSQLLRGSGVCGAIFTAAGATQLLVECSAKAPCPVGHAVITSGYNLPAKYIIHAVGPIWKGGNQTEAKDLADAYRNSLELAKENHCNSISFPLISSGIYGYPKEEALQVAVATIGEFLLHNEMNVYLVVYDRKAVSLGEQLFADIIHYIDDFYEPTRDRRSNARSQRLEDEFPRIYEEITEPIGFRDSLISNPSVLNLKERKLEDLLNGMDETFSQMLLRLIDEKGLKDVEVYKRANMDRKLFSKIRSNKEYNPKKQTVLALAIGLQLSVDETIDLLHKAGYSLSNSHKSDVIIRFFLEKKEYDIFKINEALFYFRQTLLGA